MGYITNCLKLPVAERRKAKMGEVRMDLYLKTQRWRYRLLPQTNCCSSLATIDSLRQLDLLIPTRYLHDK